MGDDVVHPSLHNSALRKRRYALEGFVLTNPLRNAFALAIVSIYFTIYRRAMDKEIHGSRSLLDKYKSPPECLSFVYSTKRIATQYVAPCCPNAFLLFTQQKVATQRRYRVVPTDRKRAYYFFYASL